MFFICIKNKFFIILINFLIQFNLSIDANGESEYVSDILPEYNENQLFEWYPKPKGEPNPSDWPGENGQPFKVPEDEQTYQEYFRIHEFNILASDRIALNRTLKDERIDGCKYKVYGNRLPNTSVIIVFHNEAFSTLLRTVHSVIKTSSNLLLEIILVDDCSDRVYLRRQLEDYVRELTVPIKVIRLGKRSGLIRARLLGSAHAKGQVLTFLDSHCECNEGWLEPLLHRIAGDRTRVVSPLIDVIDENNFMYLRTEHWIFGGFNWKIGFRWYFAPKRELERTNYEPTVPIRSATISGGLFAIDRQFFEFIGKYDPGMIIWGAENLEFSFRVWMCGGSLEIVTCSRVGHVFRSRTPYTLPGGADYVVWHNTARLIDVWLDEWNDFYYALLPGARLLDRGNIDSRLELKTKNNCKSFQWYLDNIYPESNLPNDYHFLGDIRSLGLKNLCLTTQLIQEKERLVFTECSLQNEDYLPLNQLFLFSKRNQIQNDEQCLEWRGSDDNVVLEKCKFDDYDQQKWKYNQNSKTVTHLLTNRCLDIDIEDTNRIFLSECNDQRLTQKWLLQDNFQWQHSNHTINR